MKDKKALKCPKCGLDKKESDYYRDNRYKNEVRLKSPCKQCQRKTTSEWQKKNPEKVRAKSLRCYYKDPGKYSKWGKEHPERMRESHRKWWRANPEKSDPKRYVNCCIRSSISQSLKDKKDGRSWQHLVGYTVADLMDHLEKQFAEGMTWENYGQWHIDHIIPKSVFNFLCAEDIDFKRCWELKNLQPLWARENMVKQNKLDKPFQPYLQLRM